MLCTALLFVPQRMAVLSCTVTRYARGAECPACVAKHDRCSASQPGAMFALLQVAEQTPLSALFIGELTVKAGFPPGVINILSGDGPVAGAALAGHRLVDKVGLFCSTSIAYARSARGCEQALAEKGLSWAGHLQCTWS